MSLACSLIHLELASVLALRIHLPDLWLQEINCKLHLLSVLNSSTTFAPRPCFPWISLSQQLRDTGILRQMQYSSDSLLGFKNSQRRREGRKEICFSASSCSSPFSFVQMFSPNIIIMLLIPSWCLPLRRPVIIHMCSFFCIISLLLTSVSWDHPRHYLHSKLHLILYYWGNPI